MAFNLKNLVAGGHINCYKLEGKNNYVLVLAGKTDGYIIPLIDNKDGKIAYVDPKLSLKEYTSINELVTVALHSIFEKLPLFKYCVQKAAPAHSQIIESYIQPTMVCPKADDSVIFPLLNKAGYDTSKLTATLSVSYVERDYSDLRKTAEGAARFADVEEVVKKVGAKVSELPLDVQLLYKSIKNGKLDGAIFVGPAGTGKSIAALTMAYEMGAPLIIFQASEGTQIEDMVGSYKPSEDPTKQYEHFKGVALKAFSEGYQLVINEINFSVQGIQSIFNQLVDDTPTITMDGVIYKRHPNFVLYLTMNPGYEGTNTLNQALKSRFTKVIIDEIDKPTFIQRMTTYAENHCSAPISSEFYGFLYENIAPVVQAKSGNFGENIAICIRNAQQLTDLITNEVMNYEKFEAAVHMAYTNNLSLDNNNLTNVRNFKQDEGYKTNIKKLFELYNYRIVESIQVEEDMSSLFLDDAEEVATKNVAADFNDDDFSALESDDGNAIFDDLAKEVVEEPKSDDPVKDEPDTESDEDTTDGGITDNE